MPRRTEYPAGVPCWVDTEQRDPEAAAAFYRDLFGWTTADRMPADAPQRYFVGQIDGDDVAGIASLMADAPTGPAWNTYVAVNQRRRRGGAGPRRRRNRGHGALRRR